MLSRIILCLILLINSAGYGLSKRPLTWKRSCGFIGFSALELKLPHNTDALIHQELSETNTFALLANYCGLTPEDLKSVELRKEPETGRVELLQTASPDKPFDLLCDAFQQYIKARKDGHSKEFVHAAITERLDSTTQLNTELRILKTNLVMVPVSLLVLEKSGTTTNKAGVEVSRTTTVRKVNGRSTTNVIADVPKVDETRRWALYRVIDGDIAWEYFVNFKADGTVAWIRESKCDAKEYDEKYKAIIAEVNAEVEAEMKKEGSFGQFGSVHQFWGMKRDKLKARGIEWLKPSELNRSTSYD